MSPGRQALSLPTPWAGSGLPSATRAAERTVQAGNGDQKHRWCKFGRVCRQVFRFRSFKSRSPKRSGHRTTTAGRERNSNISASNKLTDVNALSKADDITRDAASKALTERGIDNPGVLIDSSTSVLVLSWCRWWDGQSGVGPGLLAAKIKTGATPPESRRSMLDKEARYGFEIVEWVRDNFPQWNKDDGNRTHPAAIAAVIRLHHRHGKWRISKAEHGSEIRDAVRKFDDMLK